MASPKLIVHHLQVGQGERIPWLLEELNLPYELKLYQRAPLLAPPELQAVYPIGASPVLEDLTDPSHPIKFAESGAICEYVIHKYGNGRLALKPEDKNYADYLYWLHFSNATLNAGIFRRAMARNMVGEEDMRYKGNDARVVNTLEHVNNRLKENKWLAGEEFTAADIMTGWCFTTMRKFEPIDLTPYDGIMAWLKRIGERKAYRTAMAKSDPDLDIEAGLSVKGPPMHEVWAKVMGSKPVECFSSGMACADVETTIAGFAPAYAGRSITVSSSRDYRCELHDKKVLIPYQNLEFFHQFVVTIRLDLMNGIWYGSYRKMVPSIDRNISDSADDADEALPDPLRRTQERATRHSSHDTMSM
ncbi:hypothetical protein LEMA_P014460.1 [Plenodomus lingam JN3]|uniref:Glutathione S-transferase n=1 Tax=Leptosphaeria maculans (strain JN3 / isolate v23.1.3 / race Av1-4-5-6-7-8) TaxID=985895 RepID=E5A9H5_LEPMJ|nr:hypothetical protein LEMA_P014460.1 [Plenodomus lingam JN3]CBY00316.1 hypothetical protein LEMA_P014460.1 [Plenodomus lingam JN3]